MGTTISTTRALALHARQLAGEARQLAEHVARTVDATAALPAREAAASLVTVADLLDDPELDAG